MKFTTEAFFISIANSNQFGNNFTIAPKASLQRWFAGYRDRYKKQAKPVLL